MDAGNMNEKSMADHPPAYQADMGYHPSAPGLVPVHGGYPPASGAIGVQGGYPAVQGYAPIGAQPYPAQPGYPGQTNVTVQPTVFVNSSPQMIPVPDYLGYSIFTMLCCCLPLGIAALIYSINTRDANLTGNREMAMRNSHVSRLLNNIALGLGIVSYIISIIIIIISVTSAYSAVKYHSYN